jgi:hypothetical protein
MTILANGIHAIGRKAVLIGKVDKIRICGLGRDDPRDEDQGKKPMDGAGNFIHGLVKIALNVASFSDCVTDFIGSGRGLPSAGRVKYKKNYCSLIYPAIV